VPRIRAGQIYSFAMRLVYKEWAGRADVLAQVRRYLGQDTHLQDQARRSS
jgi:hypothetical protein